MQQNAIRVRRSIPSWDKEWQTNTGIEVLEAIPEALKAVLVFLEITTLRPDELSAEHAKAVLRSGVTAAALKDAIAVGAVFNIITRYALALDFAMPSAKEFDRAAGMLLKRGYAS
jgi:hypothetical protein